MKQFSIRDLLLFVAFVALALGWWIERHNRVGAPGRFQMQVTNGQVMMLDTATGEVWYQGNNNFSQPKVK